VVNQTYSNWELILADASKTDVVRDLVCDMSRDSRIRYVRIAENKGISENTNEALQYATGEYVGLLDHDDLLTPDALYEMSMALQNANKQGKGAAFVYSDEDKCDTEAKIYYEPHVKLGFNWDLLLSNNYICHFLVMKTDLIQKLGFRKEYDGAQDFDLVLRASMEKEPEDVILHVEKVLYHWRCHDLSTAANPQSKLYAYEAGKRAAESALKEYLVRMHGADAVCTERLMDENTPERENANTVISSIDTLGTGFYVNNIRVRVVHTKHNGFYRVEYGNGTAEDIFAVRNDVGVVAGPVIEKGKITSGILNKGGKCEYAGLPAKFSGYVHRMALQQDCEWVDVRNASVCPEVVDVLSTAGDEKEKINQDLIQGKGYKILYDPKFRAL